jgi:hypothetical protein
MATATRVPHEKRGAVIAIDRLHLLILTAVFIVTLPLVNPLVHGDGIGYYAYLRAPLIQHNLRFEEDWRHANLGFVRGRVNPAGQLTPDQFTMTGHVSNLFSIGPAILWTPFFMLAHSMVLFVDRLGGNISADGFSLPYRVLVAFGSSFYGFCGLLFSYLLARNYVNATWALLATLGIWFGSSLPVYMYFNPFWSHAHSAFAVALFLWYWDFTSPNRTLGEWVLLGLISGLMLDVYFPNGVLLIIPLVESIQRQIGDVQLKDVASIFRQFGENLIFLLAIGISILPTLITRKIIFGGMLRFGSYTTLPWNWQAPHWFSVLFSSEHGLVTWTPLLGLALLGLFLPFTEGGRVKAYFALGAVAFYYVISCYPYWHGLSSFGNRFFISLTPVFVFGLALSLERVGRLFRSFKFAYVTQGLVLGLFALWNLAFIFQWGTHMVPARGEISWREMVHNQFSNVPLRLTNSLETYFLHRKDMMQQIEQEDIDHRKVEKARED